MDLVLAMSDPDGTITRMPAPAVRRPTRVVVPEVGVSTRTRLRVTPSELAVLASMVEHTTRLRNQDLDAAVAGGNRNERRKALEGLAHTRDDRGSRHQPLGGLHLGLGGAARRSALACPSGRRPVRRTGAGTRPTPVSGPGYRARVFLGEALGSASPVTTTAPVLGAELELDPGTVLRLPVALAFEHGVLVDDGTATVEEVRLHGGELGYLPPGRRVLQIRADAGPARLLPLGGPPFGEPIVIWWNFVGRSHHEIAGFRADWEATVRSGGQDIPHGRFGLPAGDPLAPLPAPALPGVRLRPRT